MRMLWTIGIVALGLSTGFVQDVDLQEVDSPGTLSNGVGLERIPLVVVAVMEEQRPAGSVQVSTRDGYHIQLFRAAVNIENVLKGDVKTGLNEIYFFTFMDSYSSGSSALRFRKGERCLLFLRRDGDKLRLVYDRWRNDSLDPPVLTGLHAQWKGLPGTPLAEKITTILLTRGEGAKDEDVMKAIDKLAWLNYFGEEATAATLRKIMRTETPLVREAACQRLTSWKQPCQDTTEEHSWLQVRNLSVERREGEFRRGDRLRFMIHGEPGQTVHRTMASGNSTRSIEVGVTGEDGRFEMVERCGDWRGGRTEVWSAGSTELSPAIFFGASEKENAGKMTMIPVAGVRDRYGMGLSAVAVAGLKVRLYAAVQLDYATSLY